MSIDWKGIIQRAQETLIRRAPEILTGVGVAGMATATVLAVRATPKAIKSIEERKKALKKDKLTVRETIQAAGKHYIPAAVSTVAGAACIIGASTTSSKRNAALATAYSLAETTMHEYRDKVLEVVGEKKEKEIRDAVDCETVNRIPPTPSEVAIAEGNGKTLCCDATFGGYFYSDRASIERAVNRLNRSMTTSSERYISVNELFSEYGRANTDVGDRLGWNVDRGLIDAEFSSQLVDGTTPCLVVHFNNWVPEYNYF